MATAVRSPGVQGDAGLEVTQLRPIPGPALAKWAVRPECPQWSQAARARRRLQVPLTLVSAQWPLGGHGLGDPPRAERTAFPFPALILAWRAAQKPGWVASAAQGLAGIALRRGEGCVAVQEIEASFALASAAGIFAQCIFSWLQTL